KFPPQGPYPPPQGPYPPPQGPYPPPQGPYPPPPAYPQYGYQQPEYPQPRPRKGIIAVIIAVCVIAAGAVSVYFLRDIIWRAADPKTYLMYAIKNTAENLIETPPAIPFDKFGDQPLSHELSLRLDSFADMLPGVGALVGDSSAVITAKTDWENENLMIGFAVRSPMFGLFDIPESQIYISPETIGVSIPAALRNYGFITVDTRSFASQWNRSQYADMTDTTIPPQYASVPYNALKSIFAGTREYGSLDEAFLSRAAIHFSRGMENLPAALPDSIAVESLGRTSDRNTHMRVFIPEAEAEALVRHISLAASEAYYAAARETYPFMEIPEMGNAFAETMQPLTMMLDRIEIGGDVMIDFLIGQNGMVSGISIHEITFAIPELDFDRDWQSGNTNYTYTGEMLGYSFSLNTEFGAGKHVADGFSADLQLTHIGHDDVYYIKMENLYSFGGDSTVTAGMDVSVLNLYQGTVFSDTRLTYRFDWQPNAQHAENMRFVCTVLTDDDEIRFAITGNLTEMQQRIELSSAVFTYNSSYAWEDDYSIGFGYSLRPADPGEVSIEGHYTTDFFSIDYNRLMREFENSIFALMGN
ncbi:MAG: hypothetical protein FWH00_02295, partial [Oscillospiraceae bacterium]|nr:hypothetical protein [Oscillospiraceae bacterium]